MNKASMLFSDESIKKQCGAKLSHAEIQNKLLEMTVEFDKFCKAHGLKYVLAGGTLLGAIRHKGFIPWDDDVDIFMLREDYEKLLTFSQINSDLDVVSYKNNCGYYHPYPYCNIADRHTVMIEHHVRSLTGKGMFLDIFPLDVVPDDLKERKKFYKQILFIRYIKGIQSSPHRKVHSPKDIVLNALSAILTPLDEMKLVEKMDRMAQKFRGKESKLSTMLLVSDPSKLTWKKEWCLNTKEAEFEKHQLIIPEEYDCALRQQYGDYMVPPPIEEQNGHHGIDVFQRIESK